MLYLAFRLVMVTILYQLYLDTQLKSAKLRNPKDSNQYKKIPVQFWRHNQNKINGNPETSYLKTRV